MMNSTPPTVDDFLDESERGNHSSSSFPASFGKIQEAPVVSSSVEMPTLNKKQKNGRRAANGDGIVVDETTETSDSHGDTIMLPPTSAASLPTPEDYGMDAGTYMNRKSSGGGRRRALIGAIVCVLGLALILGTSLGATRHQRGGNEDERYKRASDTSNGQRVPPSTRDEIVRWVTDAGLSSPSAVAAAGTPQSKAIEYLLARQTAVPTSTNLALSMEDNNAAYLYAAKYVLSVLFYATAGETSWITSLRFLQHDDICDWNAVHPAFDEFGENEMSLAGVGCDGKGLPVALDLELNKVFGTLPTELGMLTTLEFLDLEYNNLRGPFPEELCNLENLQLLILGVNDLTGPLPRCAWPKMRNARFKDNDFKGTIPTEFCNMPKLLTLIVDNNDLNGEMPACTGEQWPSLLLLALSDNYLTGPVATQLTSLPSLAQLFIDGNELTGDPLATINQLNKLEFLYIEENLFTGVIDDTFCQGFDQVLAIDISENNFTLADETFPVHIFELPQLIILDMSVNALEGTFPASIPEQTTLHFFSIHQNQMNGPVPSSLTNLVNLQHIDLSNNDFTGDMTTELFSMSNLYHIYLAENDFTAGPIPPLNATMGKLREIALKNTNRVGPLPNFTNFTGLFLIDLDNNALTGTVPAHYGQLPALRHLLLNRNPDLSGNLPTFSEPSNLGTVLLDRTGIVGDFTSICNLKTIKGEQEIPTKVLVLADCDGNDAITCPCCECCSKDQAKCSEPVVTSLDWTWENGFHRTVRDFAINQTLFADDSNTDVVPQ